MVMQVWHITLVVRMDSSQFLQLIIYSCQVITIYHKPLSGGVNYSG